jgi:hypothetical protein
MEALAVAILVLGLIGANILRRHLYESKLIRHRQIIHQERLKAMEHNAPLPEFDDAELASLLRQFGSHKGGGLAGAVVWTRIVALCIGLASFFGGIGCCLGMFYSKDPEMYEYWAMGLIPVFIGFGLLVFHLLSRKMVDWVKNGAVS